ncbi:hypothetical protein CDCA_CDCA03G0855 [Cyanidium caldarium]|uniref:Glycosyl transferase family 28 C-terminal domain-containing protein n=1 Tax=Cyanidium caldarium TaxID=2771 RepID=A0AAV9IR96_CYACA|nr:hypothetical protein CDCA_CDCA03G0855 [Cyanidium caldarium]
MGELREEGDAVLAARLLIYYVTGHGLGHLTRSLAVAGEFLRHNWRVTFCTAVEEPVIQRLLRDGWAAATGTDADSIVDRLAVRTVQLDVGCVQRDAVHVCPADTLRAYAQLDAQREERIAQESQYLSNQQPDWILSDAVPLSAPAAERAGLRHRFSFITNFFFSTIYDEYLYLDAVVSEKTQQLVQRMTADECTATHVFHLSPGRAPLPRGYAGAVTPVPLVARPAYRSRESVRAALHIPPDAAVALVMFGGASGSRTMRPTRSLWDVQAVDADAHWRLLVCENVPRTVTDGDEDDDGDHLPAAYVRVPPARQYLPDLLQAADVVVGKLGYGTCSECLAYRRPLVFVRRAHFAEEPYLLADMQQQRLAVEMPLDDLRAGRWSGYLQQALALRSEAASATYDNGSVTHGTATVFAHVSRQLHLTSIAPADAADAPQCPAAADRSCCCADPPRPRTPPATP